MSLREGHTYLHMCTIYLYQIVGISKENSLSISFLSLYPRRRGPRVFLEAHLVGLWGTLS